MWDEMRTSWDEIGLVEYGIFQRDRKTGIPMWRRHERKGNSRFASIRNALFNEKGARRACAGSASYPKSLSQSGVLLVPYVAVWLDGRPFAYLVRASAGEPEITLVASAAIDSLGQKTDESELRSALATAFAEGGENYGIRLLGREEIRSP